MPTENQRDGDGDSLCVRDGIILVPYVELNGVRTLSDEKVSEAFYKMERDGTLKTVFCSGTVKNSKEFLVFAKSPGNFMTFAYVDGVLMGMAWLNNLADNHALCHFCFFRESWGKYAEKTGRHILDYWFSWPGKDGPLFDVLIGMVPATNRHAVKFAEKMGFVKLGEIPLVVKDYYSGDRANQTILYRTR